MKPFLRRAATEKGRGQRSKVDLKEKEKPPPLSKYRRKTANARERNRMKEINEAFLCLQNTLPDIPGTDADKLTKITVLKLAVTYISTLVDVLDDSTLCLDVEDVRQKWGIDNAHITRSDLSAKSMDYVDCRTKSEGPKAKNLRNSCSKNESAKKTTTKKLVCDDEKYLHLVNPKQKKAGKSRSRGKVCRTNCIATNNGAYITLKNCAIRRTQGDGSRIINNEPMMMSMTVKRTKMEPMVALKTLKVQKCEPSLLFSPSKSLFQSSNLAARCPKLDREGSMAVWSRSSAFNNNLDNYYTRSQASSNVNKMLVNESLNMVLSKSSPLQSNMPFGYEQFIKTENNNSIWPIKCDTDCETQDVSPTNSPFYNQAWVSPHNFNIIAKVNGDRSPLSTEIKYAHFNSENQFSTPAFLDESSNFTAEISNSSFTNNFVNDDSDASLQTLTSPATSYNGADTSTTEDHSSLGTVNIATQKEAEGLSPVNSEASLGTGSASDYSFEASECESILNDLFSSGPIQNYLDQLTSSIYEKKVNICDIFDEHLDDVECDGVVF